MQLDDTLENYIRRTVDFHGCFQKAPGVLLGCYMVEYAMELLGDFKGTLNAAVETRVCLADCVQVMTGCTIGNKHLWLMDEIGKYALTLYDRDTKDGVRVYLDVTKIPKDRCPELWRFHMRQRDPAVLHDMTVRKQSGEKVVAEFLTVKREVLSFQRVRVKLPRKGAVHPSIVCSTCTEPYLQPATVEGSICPACSGKVDYYQVKDGESTKPVVGSSGSDAAGQSCQGH